MNEMYPETWWDKFSEAETADEFTVEELDDIAGKAALDLLTAGYLRGFVCLFARTLIQKRKETK